MRSPTASRGKRSRGGAAAERRRARDPEAEESEDQVAEPTGARDAAENGSVRPPGRRAIHRLDGLPAEDQEKSASPPRRHARFVDARLDDDAFEHPAVMQRRVDDVLAPRARSRRRKPSTRTGARRRTGAPRGRRIARRGRPGRRAGRRRARPRGRRPSRCSGRSWGCSGRGGGGAWTTTTRAGGSGPSAKTR